MRFYRIIPVVGEQPNTTHWLPPGEDRWTETALYLAACGANVLGSTSISTQAEQVTCETCQLELLAQFLADDMRRSAWAERIARNGR